MATPDSSSSPAGATHLQAARYASGAALVAGGSGGMGQAICLELAMGGSDIALTYRHNEGKALQVAESIRASGRRAIVGRVELQEPASVQAFVQRVRDELGPIHTSVYAAGPSIPLKYISQLQPREVVDNMGADLFGCFNLIHASLPDLRATQGVLLSLTTPASRRHAKTDILSGASKAAIEALVRGVAAEEGRFGVRANGVGVGVCTDGIYHELVQKGYFHERFLNRAKELIGLRRFGSAREIADVVAFLASDKAGYVSGQVVMVDGAFAV